MVFKVTGGVVRRGVVEYRVALCDGRGRSYSARFRRPRCRVGCFGDEGWLLVAFLEKRRIHGVRFVLGERIHITGGYTVVIGTKLRTMNTGEILLFWRLSWVLITDGPP
ncbi:unnamed protein product [Laminaria digitata]